MWRLVTIVCYLMLNITMIFGVIMHIKWQLLFFPLYTKGKFPCLEFLVVNILYSWLWYLFDFNAKQSAVFPYCKWTCWDELLAVKFADFICTAQCQTAHCLLNHENLRSAKSEVNLYEKDGERIS